MEGLGCGMGLVIEREILRFVQNDILERNTFNEKIYSE